MKLKLELRYYYHVFKCSQPYKFSSNGASDTQIGKPDPMNFTFSLPIKRVWGTVEVIPSPKLSVSRESYNIVIYNQSEVQFWFVRQYKQSLKNYQKSEETRKFGFNKLKHSAFWSTISWAVNYLLSCLVSVDHVSDCTVLT